MIEWSEWEMEGVSYAEEWWMKLIWRMMNEAYLNERRSKITFNNTKRWVVWLKMSLMNTRKLPWMRGNDQRFEVKSPFNNTCRLRSGNKSCVSRKKFEEIDNCVMKLEKLSSIVSFVSISSFRFFLLIIFLFLILILFLMSFWIFGIFERALNDARHSLSFSGKFYY